jgi:dynein heavy chain
MLEIIHIVAKRPPVLEKRLKALSTGVHEKFRVFLSAEPAGDPAYHIMPTSIYVNSELKAGTSHTPSVLVT